MVGREDEVRFMLPAGWWSTAGLVISLIGVLLLFRYGMPYRVRWSLVQGLLEAGRPFDGASAAAA